MASNKEFVSCLCGGIKLDVVKGDLATEKTDAVVCTATKNLDLHRGRASKAMLTAAGNILQEDCSQGYPNGIEYEQVAMANSGGLPCKMVFLVALPLWGQSNKEQQILATTINNCLMMAKEKKFESLALPALGTGLLKYPLEKVAKTTIDCVESFSKNHPNACLKRVIVVIYPKDKAAYEAFEVEVDKRNPGMNDKTTNHKAELPRGLANMPLGKMGMSSIMSGRSLSVEEKKKNIWLLVQPVESVMKLKGDVLVNIMRSSTDIDDGELSISLLKECGKEIKQEFRRQCEEELEPGQIVVTGGHRLTAFKQIHHCYLPKSLSEKSYTSKKTLQRIVEHCLQQASRDGVKSIMFPALVIDGKSFGSSVCATIISEGIRRFEDETTDSTISRITIFLEKSKSKNWKEVENTYQEAIDTASEQAEKEQQSSSKTYLYKSLEAALKGAIERSDKGPERGTIEWHKYMYKKEPRTPTYWTAFNCNRTIKEWHMGFDDVRISLQPVERSQFVLIDKLVQDTWQSQHVGQGRDSTGLDVLNYSKIKVTQVERIENTMLFEKYIQTRQEIFRKVIRRGELKQLDKIKDSKGPILTTKAIDQDCFLAEDLFPEVNEHYMFHGTQDAIVRVIAEQGLDSRLAGSSTMFGQGVYAAESSTKADQYADDKDHRSRHNRKMFLIRMCLGKIHVHSTAELFARPPCSQCLQAKCSCGANDYCDSVVGDGSWNFREFVVYDRTQVYPEYIITYDRVS